MKGPTSTDTVPTAQYKTSLGGGEARRGEARIYARVRVLRYVTLLLPHKPHGECGGNETPLRRQCGTKHGRHGPPRPWYFSSTHPQSKQASGPTVSPSRFRQDCSGCHTARPQDERKSIVADATGSHPDVGNSGIYTKVRERGPSTERSLTDPARLGSSSRVASVSTLVRRRFPAGNRRYRRFRASRRHRCPHQ